jgi:type IV pilus assembly protein PilN
MATTLMPLDPAMSPQRSTRILTITANLLPEEIAAARRARRTRGWVIVVVALVACLCGAWFVFAQGAKQDADNELTAARNAVADLQRDQRGFSQTVKVQADTAQLTRQLNAVMANDLDWAALLDTLRGAGAPSRIEIDGVNGSLTTGDAEAAQSNVLPNTGTATPIGSLLVTGTGPDKKAVAAYVDALGKQSVVANPYITSVATIDGGGVTFSLKVDIMPASLCGRFTVECKSAGGN